jgi:hypothetical protein
MALFLTVLSGLAWTIVYAEGIRLGFRDRTYAIPLAALGLNFAWSGSTEFMVSRGRSPLRR